MKSSEIKQLRDFQRNYFEPGYKNNLNEIRLSKANSFKHNLRVCAVCCYLLKENIPFYTEVRLKCSLRVDVCTPLHVIKFIEILCSETEEKFKKLKLSKIPEELREDYVLVHTKDKFDPKVFM